MENFKIAQCSCNHSQNPLGLDRVPHFGWKMTSDVSDDLQIAYRITVAKTAEAVVAAQNLVWDSGKIESAENVSIIYQGAQLSPRTRYYWCITAWNRKGNAAQSTPAFFETGKGAEAWQAKWISAPFLKMDKTDAGATYLRKTFALKGAVKSARLYVCGLGYHEAFLEGQRVSDYLLEPAFTKYDALSYYRVHDVTALLPQSGKATLGVVLGNGWYNCITEDAWNVRQASWRAMPKLLCELHLRYADGSEACICSDESWQASAGPITFNSIRNGEFYDARLEMPDWNKSSYRAKDWVSAEQVRGAGGALQAAEMQPVRVMRELSPTKWYRNKAGQWIFDLGQNFAGKVRLTAYGAAGSKIVMRYAEELTEDGQHVDQTAIKGFVRSGEFQTDQYIKKSDAPEIWTPQFVYHGFRYVEVEGLPKELPNACITGLVMHTSFARTGEFTTSDSALSTIQRMCHWASISNCQGIPTDCPHREKNAWTGDVGTVHDQLLTNYDTFLFLEKWLEDLCQSQRPNGSIPCVCPSTGWGYNWGNGPDWSMVLTTLPWALYQQTGDVALLARYYPFICRHFAFMESMAVDSTVHYGIGDWCAPFDGPAISVNMSTFKAPVMLTDTACYYRSARLLSQMSKVLGVSDPYFAKSEAIKATMVRKFTHSGTGEVAGNCQTADGCFIFHHLLDPQAEAKLVEHLVQRIEKAHWHLDYGILGSKYVMNMLGEYGRSDVIYKMLAHHEYPGYLYWADQGCTTLAECWNLGGSHNHYMFSDISAVFYRYFAGIRPMEDVPAYRRFLLAPALDLKITSLSGSVESPHGRIVSGWRKQDDTVTYTAQIPFGTSALLKLPACVQATENNTILYGGTYTFNWKLCVSREE